MLVGDILRLSALKYPQKIGVIFENNEFTWKQTNARANAIANGLLHLGLSKQDRVAILARNCHQYLEYYFAIAKAGLIGVPLNTWLKGKELSYLIGNSGAKALVLDAKYQDSIQGLGLDSVRYRIGLGEGHGCKYDLETLIREHSGDEPSVNLNENDVFALSYTSGTTSLPKGVIVTHKNACAGIVSMALEWRFQPHSVYLMHAPMFFAAGGGARLHAVLRGCRYIIITFDATLALEVIQRERVTHMSYTPTPIKRIVEHQELDKFDTTSVEFIGLVGAPHSIAEINLIEKKFGHVWMSTYGLAETVNCGTNLTPEEIEITGPTSKRITSVGKPVLGIDLKVVREDGSPVKQDGSEMGQIILKGDMVTGGYWNLPEETSKAIRNGWLYTGDIATVDEDGYIYIVDREQDIIKSGGIKISAREVEDVVYTHPAVSACAVIGVPDEEWGESLKVLIVPKPGTRVSPDEIIELCKRNLASYKKPKSVDFVDSLPVTASGKIIKREIKERFWRGYERRVH